MLKKELEARNTSVIALQRNFESLSTMLKNEKSECSRYKQETISARDLYTNACARIKELEGKVDEFSVKVSKQKNDVESAQERAMQA